MTTILDGTGKGFVAKVDNFNRMRTFSTNTTQEHHAATLGVGYGVTTNIISVPNGFSGTVLLIENTDALKIMDIQKIGLSAAASDIEWSVIKNYTFGTPTDATAITPVNMNFSSGKSAQTNAWVWDLGGTGIAGLTAGTTLFTGTMPGDGFGNEDIDGAIVLGSNTSIAINIVNGSGGASNISVNMRVFYEETD